MFNTTFTMNNMIHQENELLNNVRLNYNNSGLEKIKIQKVRTSPPLMY